MTDKISCPEHQLDKKTGILLINLGTPAELSTKGIRNYLAEFLSDPRVIEIPKYIWLMILYGFILPFRPKKIKSNYEKIWLSEGSPLLVHSLSLLKKLKDYFSDKQDGLCFEFALRYGDPSMATALKRFQEKNCQKLYVFPMYPQYSATTTASTFDALAKILKKMRFIPEIHFFHHYCDHPSYIDAITKQLNDFIKEYGQPDQFVFSFHGLPKRNLLKGDPYYCHCHKTARLIAEKASLKEDEWQLTFQSRFGKAEWLQPYTDQTMKNLGESDKKWIAVICPGFSVDCLETLEEIQIQNKDIFMAAGGKRFDYIPCLNDNDAQVTLFSTMISEVID